MITLFCAKCLELFANENMFTLLKKIYIQLIPHNHETREKVNNKIVIHRYSKSKCQNALIFRGIKLWNTTPHDIKQSAILARFKKYLERFILSSSDNSD